MTEATRSARPQIDHPKVLDRVIERIVAQEPAK
jgi:hypothetical protein